MLPHVLDSALRALLEGVRSRNVAILIDTLCSVVPEYEPSEMLLGLVKSSPAEDQAFQTALMPMKEL